MQTKRERFNLLRSAGALTLTAAIAVGSVFTVAAAVSSDISVPETETSEVYAAVEGAAEGTELANGDIVYARADETGITVGMLEAYDITVQYGGSVRSVSLARGTVADVLKRLGIELAEDEVCEPSLTTEINGDMTVKIYSGKKLGITADGETRTVIVPNGNVAEVLNELGYEVSDDDILNVDRESNIEDADEIVIKRVTYKTETETAEVAFDSVTENSDEVELGETELKTEGQNGEKLITKRCKYIDGELAETETVGETVTTQPVDEVTLVGTKGSNVSDPEGTFTDENGSTVAYSAVYTGSATAYTASAGALTASGVAAYEGGVAVNPNVIPYGTKLYITSTDGSVVYGYATAVDTGGALMSGTALVDCFYDTYDECVSFGRRNVNVYVVG